jgi:hypothetical protein
MTHYSDRVAESAFPIDNSDNDLNTLDLKQTLEDLNEAKQIIEIYKYDPDDDATDKMTTWMKQRQRA